METETETEAVSRRGRNRAPARRVELLMTILLTGATGFVGRALVLRLLRDRHDVVALVRDPARARRLLGAAPTLVSLADAAAVRRAVGRADAIVHLAGEGIVDRRWTAARKRALHASRVDLARRLVDDLAAHPRRRPVWVNASAVGWYGDRGDEALAEDAAPGAGYAAELCRDWEAAAEAARLRAARVVRARLGVVLGPSGGALAAMLPAFRAGVGGRIGHGRQWMPWIHLEDAVEALAAAITDDALDGAVNVVAPAPVVNRDFAAALGRALGRPAVVPAPAAALRLALGERASLLLASQRVVPAALERAGFAFRHRELDGALAAALGLDAGIGFADADPAALPDAGYVAARAPRYTLTARTELDVPLAEVFPFFADAENLAAITPPQMGFVIETPTPIAMGQGTTIDYRIRVGGLPLRWRTVIEAWQPPAGGRAAFVDAQHRGPYRAWWHEHRFRAEGDRTVMEDVIHYAPPMGPLGRLANALVVRGMLREIFGYRAQAIRLRFGAPAALQPAARRGTVGA